MVITKVSEGNTLPNGGPQTKIYRSPIFCWGKKGWYHILGIIIIQIGQKKEVNINFQKVSDVGMKELNLNQGFITIRIGVDKDAQHGGMNIFGEKFGNHPRTLTLGLGIREGENIPANDVRYN